MFHMLYDFQVILTSMVSIDNSRNAIKSYLYIVNHVLTIIIIKNISFWKNMCKLYGEGPNATHFPLQRTPKETLAIYDSLDGQGIPSKTKCPSTKRLSSD